MFTPEFDWFWSQNESVSSPFFGLFVFFLHVRKKYKKKKMIHRKNLLIYGELGDISDPKVALKQVHLTDCIGGFDFYRVCDIKLSRWTIKRAV